jgi:uncharacterized protein (TIGR02058 family)
MLMALQPAILEIGTGIDLHGQDYTEAARRAVWDAVHHSSLMFLSLLGPDTSKEMIVDVTVAVPAPDEVDPEPVLAVLPHGKGRLTTVRGGMEIEPREGSGDKTVVATAAVVVRVDV